MWRNNIYLLVACALALGGAGLNLRADEAEAIKYIDKAKAAIEDQFPNLETAEGALKLAEAELDDVAAPKKAELTARIAELRKKATEVSGGKAKAVVDKEVKDTLRNLESRFGELSRVAGDMTQDLDEFEAKLKSNEYKQALGEAEIGKLLKKVAVYRKVNAANVSKMSVEKFTREMESLDKKWPEILEGLKEEGGRDSAATDFGRIQETVDKMIPSLPADDPAVVKGLDKYRKTVAQFNEIYGKAMAAEVLVRLKESWEIYKDDWAGWEKETTGPTLSEMLHQQSEAMSHLMAPKSAELISRANYWLELRDKDPKAKALAGEPSIKAFVDQVKASRQACWDKIAKSANAILTEAEKTKLNKDSRDRLERFGNDDLRLSLAGYPGLEPLQARAKKLVEAFDGGAVIDAAAKENAYDAMVATAAANWPKMVASVKPVEGFDPGNAAAFKGKIVVIKKWNRMGWDFKPNGFDFACKLNGRPVAARYSPEINAAISAMQKQTGHDMPEETDYTLICTYDGTIGRVIEFQDREGTISADNGAQARVRGRVEVAVDAPVLKVFGLYCGPIAVLNSQGSSAAPPASSGQAVVAAALVVPAQQGGSTGAGTGGGTTAAASTSVAVTVPARASGGESMLWRFLILLVGLTAAAALLLEARFAPLLSLPRIGVVRAKLDDNKLALIGIGCAIMGVLWLLRGFIYRDFLVSAAIVAAGALAALDMLVARGIVAETLAAKLRRNATLVGLTCAAMVILHLIIGGRAVLI